MKRASLVETKKKIMADLEVATPIHDLTALELFARPVEDYKEMGLMLQWKPLSSTPTRQRTFDPVQKRPDETPDTSQE